MAAKARNRRPPRARAYRIALDARVWRCYSQPATCSYARLIATFSIVLRLAAASCHRSAETDAAFVLETPRAEVVRQLKTSGAEILENTESNLVADLKRAKGKQQMRVNLAFKGGTLESVQYIPQPGR